MSNQTNTTNTNITTTSVAGNGSSNVAETGIESSLINGGSDSGGELTERQALTQHTQLLSCLEKLDQVLANQQQLERILVSQVAMLNNTAFGASVRNQQINA